MSTIKFSGETRHPNGYLSVINVERGFCNVDRQKIKETAVTQLVTVIIIRDISL